MLSSLTNDPFSSRLVGIIYGRQKIGKTTCVLRLLERGCRLVVFSYDRGFRPAFLQCGYKEEDHGKRVLLYYPGIGKSGVRTTDVVRDTKAEIDDAAKKVLSSIQKGADPSKYWIVFDTFTHFQARALSEARQITIGHQSSTRLDHDVRDAITQVDYNVNLGQMRDVIDRVISIPVNVVFICHEKVDRELRDKPRAHPNIIGATYAHLVGDADYCFRMAIHQGKRVFHTKPEDDEEGGHRTGELDPVVDADLWSVYEKMMAVSVQPGQR